MKHEVKRKHKYSINDPDDTDREVLCTYDKLIVEKDGELYYQLGGSLYETIMFDRILSLSTNKRQIVPRLTTAIETYSRFRGEDKTREEELDELTERCNYRAAHKGLPKDCPECQARAKRPEKVEGNKLPDITEEEVRVIRDMMKVAIRRTGRGRDVVKRALAHTTLNRVYLFVVPGDDFWTVTEELPKGFGTYYQIIRGDGQVLRYEWGDFIMNYPIDGLHDNLIKFCNTDNKTYGMEPNHKGCVFLSCGGQDTIPNNDLMTADSLAEGIDTTDDEESKAISCLGQPPSDITPGAAMFSLQEEDVQDEPEIDIKLQMTKWLKVPYFIIVQDYVYSASGNTINIDGKAIAVDTLPSPHFPLLIYGNGYFIARVNGCTFTMNVCAEWYADAPWFLERYISEWAERIERMETLRESPEKLLLAFGDREVQAGHIEGDYKRWALWAIEVYKNIHATGKTFMMDYPVRTCTRCGKKIVGCEQVCKHCSPQETDPQVGKKIDTMSIKKELECVKIKIVDGIHIAELPIELCNLVGKEKLQDVMDKAILECVKRKAGI